MRPQTVERAEATQEDCARCCALIGGVGPECGATDDLSRFVMACVHEHVLNAYSCPEHRAEWSARCLPNGTYPARGCSACADCSEPHDCFGRLRWLDGGAELLSYEAKYPGVHFR